MTHQSKICSLISENGLSENQLVSLSESLGKSQAAKVAKLATSNSKIIEWDEFKNDDVTQWVKSSNPALVTFLRAITNFPAANDVNIKQNVAFARALEHIMFMCNTQMICPLSFAVGLTLHFLTGSKSSLQALAACSPMGSYDTILNWLKSNNSKLIAGSNSRFQ